VEASTNRSNNTRSNGFSSTDGEVNGQGFEHQIKHIPAGFGTKISELVVEIGLVRYPKQNCSILHQSMAFSRAREESALPQTLAFFFWHLWSRRRVIGKYV
jgi:hypothetical protein